MKELKFRWQVGNTFHYRTIQLPDNAQLKLYTDNTNTEVYDETLVADGEEQWCLSIADSFMSGLEEKVLSLDGVELAHKDGSEHLGGLAFVEHKSIVLAEI